jgi:hypothetical protein
MMFIILLLKVLNQHLQIKLNFYFLREIFFLGSVIFLTVIIAMKRKLNNKTSFPMINPTNPPRSDIIIISLNHFCPSLSSSLVCFAKKFPIGIPRIKTAVPIIILMKPFIYS